MDPAHYALVSQNLFVAARDGYDVSPLIENGADPMASGASLIPLSIAQPPAQMQTRLWVANCSLSRARGCGCCIRSPIAMFAGVESRSRLPILSCICTALDLHDVCWLTAEFCMGA